MSCVSCLLLTLTFAASPEKLYGGETLAHWRTQLGHLDPADPHSAMAVPALIAIIDDQDLSSEARSPFAMTLGRMHAVSQAAIPTFIAQIERRHQLQQPTYTWAARALALYGTAARSAAPALAELLFDEQIPHANRLLAIEALARVGTAHPAVMDALIRLLLYQPRDASQLRVAQAAQFRELAAEALSLIGPDAQSAAPLLVRAVRNEREAAAVRRKAIVALGAMRGRAALAVPALIETLELEREDAVRTAAAEALAKIGSAALPVLQRYLGHPDAHVRKLAATSIAQMGPQAAPAIGTLLASLDDQDEEVRMAVCESLAALAARPDACVPVTIALLGSESRQVRMRAMRLLLVLGPQTRPYWNQLQDLADHASPSVRAIARKTLSQLQADSPSPPEL